MSEEERLSLNNYMEDLYQAMQIGNIVYEPKHSAELYNLINKVLEENEKLNHYKTLYQSLKRQKDETIKYIKLHISKETVESTSGNTYELKELYLSDYKLSQLLKILEGVEHE